MCRTARRRVKFGDFQTFALLDKNFAGSYSAQMTEGACRGGGFAAMAGEGKPDTRTAVEDTPSGGQSGIRIRCPRCEWEPCAQDRWVCKCKHVWNTFETGGVCPACLFQWQVTQCLRCKEYSAHSDWYEQE